MITEKQIFCALGTASGTRICLLCDDRITHRTVMINIPDTGVSLAVHPECARVLADALNVCPGVIRL